MTAEHRRAPLWPVQDLRAVAALSVMVSHNIGDIAYHGGPTLFDGYYAGAAGVDMFFVISGFIMVHTAGDRFGVAGEPGRFILRRLARLVPLYWLATLAYAAMLIAQGKGAIVDPRRIALSLLFIPDAAGDGSGLPFYGVGWTLNDEALFYAVFAAGLLFRRRIGLPLVVLGLAGLVAAGAVAALPQPFRFWAQPILVDFLFGLALGLAFARGMRLARPLAAAAAAAGLAALAGATALGFNFDPGRAAGVPRCLVWGLPCAAVFAGTVWGAHGMGRSRPVLGLLGDASYVIYLLHPFAIIALRPLLGWSEAALGLPPTVAALLQLAVVGAAVAAASLVLHVWLERPMTRRLGRLVAARRPAGRVYKGEALP